MNRILREIASEHQLDDDRWEVLRIAFGVRCAARASNLITDDDIAECMQTALDYVDKKIDRKAFQTATETVVSLAASHRGSIATEGSLDGAGHAAVSASTAVSNAMQGNAWNAAEYAAYAQVYAYSSYSVTDPNSFEKEYRWQVQLLKKILVDMP